MGPSDATAHGLQIIPNWISCDGVFESDGAIEEGQYVLWGHEHLYGRNGISGYQDTDAQIIFNGITASIATLGSNPAAHDAAIALPFMHCTKSSDVAFPTR
jgi:hypothetical protein